MEQPDIYSQLFSVKGRVIIITGGAGFLGMQYGETLSLAGAHVILLDHNEQDILNQCVATINSKGGLPAYAYKADVAVESEIQEVVSRILKQFGRIDVLINNAAMNPAVGSEESKNLFAPYEEYSIELWKRELDTNLTGAMLCTKLVAPIMMKQGGGSIINIASEISVIAYDHRIYEPGKFKSIAYITSKTGILGLTRAWAARLGEFNVRVNAFSPGGVQTEKHNPEFVKKYSGMNMLGRMAKVGEYGGIMLFLCSDASSFMTGSNLIVDGGKTAW